MAMKICKECNKEVSSSAKKCPHCGKDQRNFFMKHKILTFIGVIIIISIITSIGGEKNDNKATVSPSTLNDTNKEVVGKIGDTIKTDKFEITIIKVEERKEVGSDYFNSKPSEGGTYVCVQWKYKNISDKPVGTFSQPTVKVVDKNDVKYDADIGASSNYATEVKIDNKILSDVNPGITVKDAEVYEISKDLYAKGGWRLLIKADKDAYVTIN